MSINKIAANSIVVGMLASQIGASVTASDNSDIDTDTSLPDAVSRDENKKLETDNEELTEKDEYLVYEDYIEQGEDDSSVSLKFVSSKSRSISKDDEVLADEKKLDNNLKNSKQISNMKFDLSIYPEDIANDLTVCINLLSEYEKSEEKDISKLKEIIDVFYLMPTVIEDNFPYEVTEWDVFDFIFNFIRDEIYSIQDSNEQSTQIIYFTEKIFLGWRKAKVDGYWYKTEYLNKGLYEYNKDKNKNAQPRLEYLKLLSDYFMEYTDYEYLSNKIPIIDIPKNEIIPPLLSPPNIEIQDKDPIGNTPGTSNNTVSSSKSGYITEYKKVGDKCIKIKSLYKDGKLISSTEITVPKSQYPKCGIYTYIHSVKYEKNRVEVNRDYLDNDQNIDSDSTIYYTVNKLSETPYYYDTGIRVSAINNSVNFNQLVDALYQVAIKVEGFTMDDNDKSLVIMEGKPIVLKNDKEIYSKSEVENLLNSFQKVGFKIMESSERKSYTLENYLIEGKMDVLNIDGYDLKLSTPLKLENEKVVGPIQEIFTYLKGSVNSSNNKSTIKLNGDTIVLNIGSNKYSFNGKPYTFKNVPKIEDASIMAELDTILNHLGYSLMWDSDFGKLTISKK